MRFFGSAILAVATLASIVSGQAAGTATVPPPAETTPAVVPVDASLGDNPISSPTLGDEFKAGKPVTIVWNPTTGGTVSLRLRKGDESNLDAVTEITKTIPNTGSFTWTPSTSLEGDEDYTIEIVPSKGEPNYSNRFTIDSEGSGLSSSTTATTLSTSTTKTTSSAKPTTTDDEEEDEDEDDKETTTTKSQTKTTTSDASSKTGDAEEDEEDKEAPNSNSGATGIASSPMALVLCLAAAVAYLN